MRAPKLSSVNIIRTFCGERFTSDSKTFSLVDVRVPGEEHAPQDVSSADFDAVGALRWRLVLFVPAPARRHGRVADARRFARSTARAALSSPGQYCDRFDDG